jgi:transaldolase/glucose-6-phosphate isomerase
MSDPACKVSYTSITEVPAMADTGDRTDQLGPLSAAVDAALADLRDREAVRRLWDHDHTLWSDDPTELADRLGWLDVLSDMLAAGEEIDGFVRGLKEDGFTHAVVMGMGGSSLFPEVIARSFPRGEGGLELSVLDSTDPAAVGKVAALAPEGRTLFLTSSKSGGTIETRSHLEFFWDRVGRPEQFAVVTDPGSELAGLARERGFRHVFENRTDIGGRYSALSFFGLVPAALAGVDWRALVDNAAKAAEALRSSDPAENPGLWLGAAMGAGVKEGRDKLTLVLDPRMETFGLWLEQLIAESTGKAGTGVVPIVDEALGPIDAYGNDRLFVALGDVDHPVGLEVLAEEGHPVAGIGFDDPLDLGAQCLIWEVATALCGAVLGINPFDQPNVAEAKEATGAVLAGEASLPEVPPLDEVLGSVASGDYISIHAYVEPDDAAVDTLEEVRLELRDKYRVATTFALGPRFLHSTGQLHKGGAPTGVFLQVVGDDPVDAEVPGRDFTFSELKRAQADGDLITLVRHGLRVARVTVDELVAHLS